MTATAAAGAPVLIHVGVPLPRRGLVREADAGDDDEDDDRRDGAQYGAQLHAGKAVLAAAVGWDDEGRGRARR